MSDNNKPKRMEETATSIVDQVKELIEKGNMRRVVVHKSSDAKLFEVSLTVAVAVIAVVLIFVPAGFFWMLLAVVAGIIAKLRVEILREITDDDDMVEGEIIQ